MKSKEITPRQQFLLKTLGLYAEEIQAACKEGAFEPDSFGDRLVKFMALVHMIGKEDILPELTPAQVAGLMEISQADVEAVWGFMESEANKNQTTD